MRLTKRENGKAMIISGYEVGIQQIIDKLCEYEELAEKAKSLVDTSFGGKDTHSAGGAYGIQD